MTVSVGVVPVPTTMFNSLEYIVGETAPCEDSVARGKRAASSVPLVIVL